MLTIDYMKIMLICLNGTIILFSNRLLAVDIPMEVVSEVLSTITDPTAMVGPEVNCLICFL